MSRNFKEFESNLQTTSLIERPNQIARKYKKKIYISHKGPPTERTKEFTFINFSQPSK